MNRVFQRAAALVAACCVGAALLPCVISAAGTPRKKKVTSFNLSTVKQSEDHINPPPPNGQDRVRMPCSRPLFIDAERGVCVRSVVDFLMIQRYFRPDSQCRNAMVMVLPAEGRQLWQWSHYTTATDPLAQKDLEEWEKQVAEQRKQEDAYLKRLLADDRTLNELLEHHEQARELVSLVHGTYKGISHQAGNPKYTLATNVAKASVEAAEAAVQKIEEEIAGSFPLHDGTASDRPSLQRERKKHGENAEQDLGLLIKRHVASRAIFQQLQISRYIAGRDASSPLAYNDSNALR